MLRQDMPIPFYTYRMSTDSRQEKISIVVRATYVYQYTVYYPLLINSLQQHTFYHYVQYYIKLYLPLHYIKCFCEGSLLRNIDPVPGSSYHSLSINSSKTEGVADSETCTISDPQITIFIVFHQYIGVGCVYNQVLHISPCQVVTISIHVT